MNKNLLAVALVLGIAALPAVSPLTYAADAAKGAAAATAAEQPELASLVGARKAELVNAGVRRIVAVTGKKRRDIQVVTPWGGIYFAWPKGVEPATFDLVVGPGDAVTVRSSAYTDALKPKYAAAFDAIIPKAIASARDAKARAEKPTT